MPPVEAKFQDVTSEPFRTRIMPQLSSSASGSEQPRRWIKRYRTEASASSASVLSTITAFPLDSVKTRLQTYPYNGFTDCVRKTFQEEGLRGFFRGEQSRSCPTPQPARFLLGARLTRSILRGHCSLGQCHSRANCILFNIPTLEICILGLDEEAFWLLSARPRQ
jgi:hypothetical protein